MNDDNKKKIDNDWKEAVEKEKTEPDVSGKEEAEASFGLFVSGLLMEAMISLGEMENPLTKKKETNLKHAKFIIDTLGLLKDKTRNNLSPEESEYLESILYETRMRFLNKSKK